MPQDLLLVQKDGCSHSKSTQGLTYKVSASGDLGSERGSVQTVRKVQALCHVSCKCYFSHQVPQAEQTTLREERGCSLGTEWCQG